jgi:hypothetical protein
MGLYRRIGSIIGDIIMTIEPLNKSQDTIKIIDKINEIIKFLNDRVYYKEEEI